MSSALDRFLEEAQGRCNLLGGVVFVEAQTQKDVEELAATTRHLIRALAVIRVLRAELGNYANHLNWTATMPETEHRRLLLKTHGWLMAENALKMADEIAAGKTQP